MFFMIMPYSNQTTSFRIPWNYLTISIFIFFSDIMFKDIYSSIVLVLTIISTIVNVVPTISLISSWKRLHFSEVLLLNIFITNLMLGIGYLLPLHRYFAGHSALSSSYCDFTGYLVFFLACTNIYTMEALSIHRYILIKKPLLIGKFKLRKDVAVTIVVIMWIIGAIATSPTLYGISRYTRVVELFTCELDFNSQTPENKTYVSFAAIQGYVIPAIVMAFCGYHCIFSSHVRSSTVPNGRSDLKNPRAIRFTRSIYAMFLSFLIAWFPYVVVCFCNLINVHVNDILYAICTLFGKASATVVTVVYMVSYRGLRRLLFYSVCWQKEKRNERRFRTLIITSSDSNVKHEQRKFRVNNI